MADSALLNTVMPAELKARVQQAARAERRSMSNLVCYVLENWLNDTARDTAATAPRA